MNNRDNTNLRYHIFKELDKHLKSKQKKNPGTINAFVLPVFSGILSTIIASWIQSGNDDIQTKLLIIFIFTLSFFLIYGLSNLTARIIYKYIVPIVCRQNKSNEEILAEKNQDERAAKINYEVAYLVNIANSYVSEETTEDYLRAYNYAEAAFHIATALRKINEALCTTTERISPDKLPNNRINTIMVMIAAIVKRIDTKNIDESMIMDITTKYNHIAGFLATTYGIVIQPVNNNADYKWE